MRRTGFAAVAFLAAMIASLTPANACCHIGFDLPAQENEAFATFAQDGYSISINKYIATRVHVNVVGTADTSPNLRDYTWIGIREPDGRSYDGSGPTIGYIVRLTGASLAGSIETAHGRLSISLALYADSPARRGPGDWQVSASGLATIVFPDGKVIGPLAPEFAQLRSSSHPV